MWHVGGAQVAQAAMEEMWQLQTEIYTEKKESQPLRHVQNCGYWL